MPVTNPVLNFSLVPANTIQNNQPQAVLFVGQKTSSGTATPGALVQDIQNDGSEATLFGANSMLAEMIRAFKKINVYSRIDVIPLSDNGAGVAATGTITFTASSPVVGTLTFYIGSQSNHAYTLPVSTTDTAITLAAALVALISADTKAPVTAANVSGVVTLTAVHKGVVGNSVGIKIDGTVSGVTATVVAMASGATNPVLTNLFSPVTSIRYQTVVYPSEYGLSTLTAFLDPRFNVNNILLDGVGIATSVDTLSNLTTLANSFNSQSLVIIGNKLIARNTLNGGAIFELPYVISAIFAAVRSLRFTQDANISQYVIGGSARDQFGGAALASLPYFNTPFATLPLAIQGDEFIETEQESLNTAGVSILGNNTANSSVIAGKIVTTYKTNGAGVSDPTYKYLNYVDTAVNAREFMFNNAKSNFAQSRLTTGDLVPNRNMQNATSIAAAFTGYYQALSGEDYVLLAAGELMLQFFKRNLSVAINTATNSATVGFQLPIVTQLGQLNVAMQIAFSTTS